MPTLYDTDFHQWTHDMAEAIPAGRRVNEADAALIAEEIEDVGKSELNKLESALEQLFLHLPKQPYRPELSGRSWQNSVNKHRFQIARLLKKNPSFQRHLKDEECIEDAYRAAIFDAVEETDHPAETFQVAEAILFHHARQ